MSNFDWYTEEDVNWKEEPPKPSRKPGSPWRWQRWMLILAILVVSGATAAALVYRRLSQRVEEVSYAVEADVRDSFGIVYQSAMDGDRDLFVPFLSGFDPDWASAQERVVSAGLFYARPGFGLVWLPQQAETAVSAIRLDPTLTAAVLTTTHDYAVDVGNGFSQTITLQRTAVYRLGPGRWLYAPPRPEFWGEARSSQGTLLTLTYPERDEEVARRLAVDLEAKIRELCTRFADLNCPPDLHVTVELSTNPAAIYEANQLPQNVTITVPRMRSFGWYSFPVRLGDQNLTLPTPTLLGLPVDEAGYQALYRGYAARVVSAVVAERVGWECCDRATLFQVLLDVQLDQLGLKRWPVRSADYEAMLDTPLTAVYDAWRHVDLTELEDTGSLYVLVDFLLRDLQISPVRLQQAVTEVSADSWLNAILATVYPDPIDADRGWLGYLYKRSPAYGEPPPQPLPEQPLHLVCRPNVADAAFLYRYEFERGEFEVARALEEETAVLLPLTGGKALLVGETSKGLIQRGETFIWANNRAQVIARQGVEDGQSALPLASGPEGRQAALAIPGESVVPYSMLDVAACRDRGQCELSTILGRPYWSPDAQHTLLKGNTLGTGRNSVIFLGDASGESITLIGEGRFPFWLDSQKVGYVTPDNIVVTSTLSVLDGQPLVGLDDLLPEIAESASTPSGHYFISYAGISLPYDRLILNVTDIGGVHYLLDHSLSARETRLHFSWRSGPESIAYESSLSPDGRWLTILNFIDAEPPWSLIIFDLETGKTQMIPLGANEPLPLEQLAHWSPDGSWLIITHDGYMRLVAPEAAYERWLIPDRMACDQAVFAP